MGTQSGFGGGAVFAMVSAGESRDLARHGVAMERAFAGRLVEHAGRLTQLLLGAIRVGALDRLDGLLYCAVHAGLNRTITVAPLKALAMALLG